MDQSATQIKPIAPTMTKAHFQFPCNKAQTTNGGAHTAPIEEPILNQPMAIDRSFAGNHSVVALTPAGIPADSASPRKPRNAARLCHPVASDAAAQAKDQANANNRKPIFVPSVSSNTPAMGCINE